MTSFTIIPVLDLKQGNVVRARAGNRAEYHPISSPLAPDSAPESVLRALLDLARFNIVYIADLDAITGTGSHQAEIRRLSDCLPQIEFWVDAGFADPTGAHWTAHSRIVPVFGTESLAGAEILPRVVEAFGNDGFILSLDYRGEQFIGPAEIEARVAQWPQRVILMTLQRVGMQGGPAFEALRQVVRRAHPRQVFAAGGVRGEADLDALRGDGVAGALVASALHDGALGADVLKRFLPTSG